MIQNNELDVNKFKEFFPNLDWLKIPRMLSVDVSDYFYIGTYETEDRKVQVSIRPSMRMQVTDTNKKCTKTGETVPEDFVGRMYQYSTSVEVSITDSLLDKIKAVAKVPEPNKNQVVSWE